MNRGTLKQVAELHAAGIDRGFLATLGTRFLRLMYQAIAESPTGVLEVEQRDGRVVGFIAGSDGMRPVLRAMMRHPFALAAALAPVLVRPRTVAGILEVLRAGSATQGEAQGQPLPRAELLSLAVDARHRGQGIADSLYRTLQARFRAVGITSFRIVVGDALLPARRFYERMGARPVTRTEIHRGAASTIYVHETRDLCQADDPAAKEAT